jgi:hypothetical protein
VSLLQLSCFIYLTSWKSLSLSIPKISSFFFSLSLSLSFTHTHTHTHFQFVNFCMEWNKRVQRSATAWVTNLTSKIYQTVFVLKISWSTCKLSQNSVFTSLNLCSLTSSLLLFNPDIFNKF